MTSPEAEQFAALTQLVAGLEDQVAGLTARVDASESSARLGGAVSYLEEVLADLLKPADEETEDPGGRLVQIETAIAAIAAAVEEIAAEPRTSKYKPPIWIELGPEDAEREWTGLIEWVEKILLGRYWVSIRPCWYKHSAAVEELTWLRYAWKYSYEDPTANPVRAADFHSRQKPHVLAELREIIKCSPSKHDPETAVVHVDEGEFRKFVSADCEARPAAE